MNNEEQKFYDALQEVFVGAEVTGQGGFINLMKIKSGYYRQIKDHLKEDIEDALGDHPGFREELFDKLHAFFSRYFTQNGSICFNETAFHNDVYEKVYTDEKDVVLFWKTHMLYYVKTDTLFKDMPVEFGGMKFYFDASAMENKKTNEKRETVFSYKGANDGTVILAARYAENGKQTCVKDILKEVCKEFPWAEVGHLQRAFRLFNRQSECDYFINKNAEQFLKEQFNLWTYRYFWEGSDKWDAGRVNQLQILKHAAFKVIDFVAQFEDELLRVWNKPKFVKNANYVITLDRVDSALVSKIKKHKGYAEQTKEWKSLGIDKDSPKAPIDTRFFKDIELDILAQFDNLDESLDGWLIKSENYQALNTILPKFEGKVQCIYVDPPFNTGDDFAYVDQFQDSTWLTLMRDRFHLARDFLSDTGYFYLQLDHYADHLGRILMDEVFHEAKVEDQAFITWNTGDNISGFKTQRDNWIRQADRIMFTPKNPAESAFVKMWSPLETEKDKKVGWLDFIGDDGESLYIETWDSGKLTQKKVDVKSKRIGTVWNDIYSFQYSALGGTEGFSFATQKPENLLRRVIQSCSHEGDIVLDFFSGIGTTPAVAQKLGRKWIAVEFGEHFGNTYEDKEGTLKVGVLGRLKLVINGDRQFSLPNTTEQRRPHLTKDVNWQGGGFFKYYELEQYEEALANCKYTDGDVLNRPDQSVYEQYVFLPDEKLLAAMEPDSARNKVDLHLDRLYENIDIAETLSHLTGKWIKSIQANKVQFVDGTETDTQNLDYHLITRLIWWEQQRN